MLTSLPPSYRTLAGPSSLGPAAADAAPLHRRAEAALSSGDPDQLRACRQVPPADERDELLTLLSLHDLALSPLHLLGERATFHGHPATAELQHPLQAATSLGLRRRSHRLRRSVPDGVAGVRRAAALDRVPAVYEWLRDEADWDHLVRFLAIEGGPDAGFDDLVALGQIGIDGVPKLALAENYWDEMGRGRFERVHTELHHRLVDAVDMQRVPAGRAADGRTRPGGAQRRARDQPLAPARAARRTRRARAAGRPSLSSRRRCARATRRVRRCPRLLPRARRDRSPPRQGLARPSRRTARRPIPPGRGAWPTERSGDTW